MHWIPFTDVSRSYQHASCMSRCLVPSGVHSHQKASSTNSEHNLFSTGDVRWDLRRRGGGDWGGRGGSGDRVAAQRAEAKESAAAEERTVITTKW
jgi:hypothetical protein